MQRIHRDRKWMLYLFIGIVVISLFIIAIIVLSRSDTPELDFSNLFGTNEESS
ncbi:hypothetical protein [Radiobacillus sp. PE A8.2]|uniref:hypothetical protein n=1 Tax=Radiobacillus sp. PE A8.2 TaxID=3380349 RepID=UPI00389076DB